VNRELKTRELVSFDGPCPYKCKHCYTFGLNEKCENLSSEDIIKSLEGKNFDVIYVSHNKENFIVPTKGIDLCRKLFNKYHKDIIAITRNVFNEDELDDFSRLNDEMNRNGKILCLAVSIPALESVGVTEGEGLIPTPQKRIDFLKRAKAKGLRTVLVIRPLFPDKFIPISEPLQLIEECKDFVDCVLSSGLAVNDAILKQLEMKESDFNYLDGDNSNYLIGAIGNAKYIDVKKEIQQLKEKCKSLNIHMFDHSLEALKFFDHSMEVMNYLKKEKVNVNS